MDVVRDLTIIVVFTPLLIMMMVFVNGRDAFPSTMMMFWRCVLWISGETMPETRREKADRLVEGTRLFAKQAKTLEPLIGPTVDRNTRGSLLQRRYEEHREWDYRARNLYDEN